MTLTSPSTQLAAYYALFAAIATGANILAQDLTTRAASIGSGILASVIVGTGVGLIIKYLLDKRFIFRFRPYSLIHDTKIFGRYVLMGLVTTFIFWGFEFGFELLFANKVMRYTGAILGLTIGYLLKYQLDKRYVFREQVP